MEIEAKVKLKNPSKVRASLKSARATCEGRVLEKNWLYDHPERTLARIDKLLRIREDQRVTLAFKGPRQQSEYKKREELEIEFPTAMSARALLESIGFVRWFYYEKIRETWKLGLSEIVLDELPHLGLFVEVEAPNEGGVDEIVKKLKLPHDYISTTYVELLREFAARLKMNIHEFKFPPEHEFALGAPVEAITR